MQTGDVFAMKVIDRQRGRSHRLATERKVLFSCNSPFVVTTYFAFEDTQRLYLVMECLHSDCKQLLQARRPPAPTSPRHLARPRPVTSPGLARPRPTSPANLA